MHRLLLVLLAALLVLSFSPAWASAQPPGNLSACKDCAFSTEEDFLSRGPVPADGNPIISDGDLLSCTGAVCLRNAQLLQPFDVSVDLGLDAVDVLDVERGLVVFSTELNSPYGTFTHGDLLSTWGTVIPNAALLILFQVEGDRGLDAVHMIGDASKIVDFIDWAKGMSRDEWLREPGRLAVELKRYEIDIWFSIEGTEMQAAVVPILDGDVLSAANGTVIASNDMLLPGAVPAGIPSRGVDLGCDALTAARSGRRDGIRFSTEILHRGQFSLTDGDVLKFGDGIYYVAKDLYNPFEPVADFLGTDAFYRRLSDEQVAWENFLSLVYRLFVSQPMARPLVEARGVGLDRAQDEPTDLVPFSPDRRR
jgi:hypothetical protein